ncbi:AAA family ATPase [Intrasporangium flavum]|uniref:AAA family ATPase n=1 Tax=Intrasporangium flavum TaxID=1428657 RepID=UPI0009FAF04B|nr:ATP-binding protein [Intrasporangium flavum]
MTEQSGGEVEQTREFTVQFQRLIRRMLEDLPDDSGGDALEPVLTEHLGVPSAGLPVVSEPVPHHRAVDADLALEAVAGDDAHARVIGLSGDMRHHLTLGDILQHGPRGPVRVGQVDYDRLDTGPAADQVRQVITSGIWLLRFEGRPAAVRVQGSAPQYGRQEGRLEVLAPDRDAADALVTRLRELMDELSVLRGKVVTLVDEPFGHGFAGITFVPRPDVDASAVVLPDGLLDRVVHHVVGMGEHRSRLRDAGQHLKRGVLLYGPPGTGKTHTIRHLLARTPGTTAVLLAGGSLRHIHAAASIARAHQPAIVVLEDCDLVAEDRSFGMGPSPLLFEVLDTLDGLDADADVAFLLTTNRVEDLEVALAQRPGRVDLAAEIPLPDAEGRLALLRLYGGHLFSAEAMSTATARTEGTTASFTKELVRRAVLAAAIADEPPADDHLGIALDELLSDGERLTRSLLGVDPGAGDDAEPGPAPFPPAGRPRRGGFHAYAPGGGAAYRG